MRLDSSNSPIYLPQRDQESVLRLGFENCSIDDWLFAPDDLALFHRHKTSLGGFPEQSFNAEIPQSIEAQREFHDFLLEQLLANPRLGYSKTGTRLRHSHAKLSWELGEKKLWPASLWIAEDICLLQQQEDEYRVTAASVCSPSNWSLEEKIGQSIDFIHAPVPCYQQVLSERVNRFLRGLRSTRVMLRYNWSVQSGNELRWRDGSQQPLAPSDDELYWRVERQTFLRLPRSGAIVFAIRIFLHSIDGLRKQPGFKESLQQLLAQLPAAEKHYKSLL